MMHTLSSFINRRANSICKRALIAWLLLLLGALPVLPVGAAVPAAPPQENATLRDITYCTAGDVALKMDIYLPTIKAAEPAPTIVYVHGGSWLSGDKWEIGLAGEQLASAGYVVASVNYRLAPDYRWPAQIEDVKCAIRYLRANSSTYNLDPNRIGTWGSSAGGQLVSLLGLAGQNAGFDVGQYMDQSSSVQAVVDMFGPTDLTAYNPDDYAKGVGEKVFGIKPGQTSDVLAKASPVTYVTGGAPPFLILQGDKDTLVPPGQSQELYDKLQAAGDQARLVMVKNAGHAFVPTGGDISPSIGEIKGIISAFFDTQLRNEQAFPQTGKTLSGRFLSYWQQNGGLSQFGYPISPQMQERSDTDGKTYTVQYFERALFQSHTENLPPNDVLLALLGTLLYNRKYPGGAPGQTPNTSPGSLLFPQTGKRLGGMFLQYWQSHGGLAEQGYPISDEFTEIGADGKPHTVQYFERAVFEYHPENQSPYKVLLSALGTERYGEKYPAK